MGPTIASKTRALRARLVKSYALHSRFKRNVSTSMQRLIVSVLLLGVFTSAVADWSGVIANEVWQLPSSATGSRWLVIHNLASAETDGIYHVEVIERPAGAEAWNIKHVANHLAVTPTALRASIIKPLKKGAVYPESFEYAYAEWKKQKAQGNAAVCNTSVLECLK